MRLRGPFFYWKWIPNLPSLIEFYYHVVPVLGQFQCLFERFIDLSYLNLSEYITRERDQRGSALTPYRYQIGFVAPISYYRFAACSSPSPENKKLPSMGAYSYLSKRETRLPTGKTET
jgi:hypothetical protein